MDPDPLISWLRPSEHDRHFRVEGRHAVRAALQSDFSIVALCEAASTPDPEIEALGRTRGLQPTMLDRATLSAMLGFDFRRGVVAVALKPESGFADWAAAERPVRLAVLDRLADPGNVGTIVRNAAAFGFDAAVCSRAGVSPYNAKAVRASATALFRLPVFVMEDWRATLAEALPGLVLVGTDVSPLAEPLGEFARRAPAALAVVFGSEADGLSPEVLAACDRRITIPISRRVESINVASASAIVLQALGNRDRLN